MLLLLALVLLTVPFLLPRERHFSEQFLSPIPMEAVMRCLARTDKQHSWWPEMRSTDSVFTFKDTRYKTGKILTNSFDATSIDSDVSTQILTTFVAGVNQTTLVNVQARDRLSANPYMRLVQYLGYPQRKSAVQSLAQHIGAYFSATTAIYGVEIELQQVRHSPHLSLTRITDSMPSTEDCYAMIRSVQAQVAAAGAQVVDSPIMHIVRDGKQFLTMVAVPTNRVLTDTAPFMLKQMVLGNILVAKVVGGPEKVRQGEIAMDYYVSDFRKTSPAIRFQRLITNRLTNPDSTQWITTINYPVFR